MMINNKLEEVKGYDYHKRKIFIYLLLIQAIIAILLKAKKLLSHIKYKHYTQIEYEISTQHNQTTYSDTIR